MNDKAPLELMPLEITCTSSACDSGLHCFKATRELRAKNAVGACRSCGAELVDWQRVHDRNAVDATFTFEQLKLELIRHYFWHVEFDQKALDHALRKGRKALHAAARRRLESSVGRAGSPYDGRQTPFKGNTLYYAQHATASCCRACMEYWHAIPKDRDLTEDELEYLASLMVLFLDERLPDLPDDPTIVPRKPRPRFTSKRLD